MPVPPETDVAKIRKYCRAMVPARLLHQVRIEAAVRGASVTIFDCRPPWHPSLTEWSKVRVAQLRYSANTHHWSLYWADRNGRWHRYDDLDSGPLDTVLNEIEDDPQRRRGRRQQRSFRLSRCPTDGARWRTISRLEGAYFEAVLPPDLPVSLTIGPTTDH